MAAPTAAFAQTMPAGSYVAKAGASDLFERQSGMVMAKSRNADIRQYAMMMTRDHAKSTADVKMAARAGRVPVAAPRLSPMQARDLAALKRARGDAQDRLYIEQQKAAHQEALTLQQGYATDGTVAPLRMAAGKIVPVVEHHIQMLAGM
ncbi:MAG: DUF4142 domain-containing protein [Tardiphaga sp.]